MKFYTFDMHSVVGVMHKNRIIFRFRIGWLGHRIHRIKQYGLVRGMQSPWK
jgi:hypothetical protein